MSNSTRCATALEFLRPTVENLALALDLATMPRDGTQSTLREISCQCIEKGNPASTIQDCINACYKAFGVNATAKAIEELRYQGYNDVLPNR